MVAADICKACGDCPRSTIPPQPNATFGGFGVPLGIGFLEQRPCAPPAELGVDNAWLPATHTSQRTFAAGGGTWLYYAAGCSDLLWNVGRTLLVKNRCHAVVALEARLNRTLHEAAMRVVRRLPAWSKALVSQARRGLKTNSLVTLPRSIANDTIAEWALQMAWLLEEASTHGVFWNGVPDANCNPWAIKIDERCNKQCKSRAFTFSALCGTDDLDHVLRRQLVELATTATPVDTIQFHQQPQGGRSLRWLTEIWDVRAIDNKRNATSRPTPPSSWGSRTVHHDGSAHYETYGLLVDSDMSSRRPGACLPSANFSNCFACRGSKLDRLCEWRDWQSYCDEPQAKARAQARGYQSAMCGMHEGVPVDS